MGYLTLIIALGIVILFGLWSGRQRYKFNNRQKRKKTKGSSPSGPERLTKLRRVK